MSEAISLAITARVREIRQVKGITRDELSASARAAGAPESLTTAALRNIEIGRRPVSVDELVWLSSAFGVPPLGLLGEYAELFGADEKPAQDCGAVEEATRLAVLGLGPLQGRDCALAEAAYALAKKLDDDAGMAAAAVSKELRAVLDDIWAGHADEEDEDDLGAA